VQGIEHKRRVLLHKPAQTKAPGFDLKLKMGGASDMDLCYQVVVVVLKNNCTQYNDTVRI